MLESAERQLDQELLAPKCLERGLANRAWRLCHGPFGNLWVPECPVFPTAAACAHCAARSAFVHEPGPIGGLPVLRRQAPDRPGHQLRDGSRPATRL